jgi:prevent-host-death family protein
MEQVQIAQAKAHLSALIERVESGEEIIIARRGKAVARLVPEPRAARNAAEALAPAWALGGLKIEPMQELPADRSSIDLD